ncbi:MAG TPA: HAMP domain-containing sensor histidine kinase [Candidatus Bathyarchaeia archaeon]|nr:HAMP domain-containing sensor histidine kinase [Candidatus Bathyarchaeia archaeon]
MNEKARLIDLLIHDMREPLSIVAAATNNLRYNTDRNGPLTDDQKRLLDRISRNADKAQNLIQEMIEILRSEGGVFQKEYFSVETTVKKSLLDALEIAVPEMTEKLYDAKSREEFQAVLREHGISVEVRGKYCECPFCHDERKVRQILRNLMSNAMKYRRERMRVNISGEKDLAILVEDDGMGIPPEKREAVFAPIVQLKNQRNSNTSGLGFGLTGVKTLVEAMGGEIEMKSQEGTGTRFIVRIPPFISS